MVRLVEHGDDHGHSEEAEEQGHHQVEDQGQQLECRLALLQGLGGGGQLGT